MAEAETTQTDTPVVEQTTTETTETTTERTPTLAEAAVEEKAVAVPADWPEDWRDRLAGNDADVRKRLNRFHSPQNVLRSMLEAEKKLSSGRPSTPFPDKGSDEEKAAWRKEQGIPAKADDYFSNLDGFTFGEHDKPALAAFAERMHALNAKPEIVKDAVGWYFERIEDQKALQAEADAQFRAQTEDALRKEWGDKYRGNVSAITGLLDTAPEGVKANLLGARLADGTSLGDNADALRFLARLALEINPAATVVPGAGTQSGQTIATEIAAIEKRMFEDRDGYFRDEAMQARYDTLLAARERMASRQAI